jgi:hypothetical protein
VAVVPLIGHLVGYDQMVLGVDSDLYIVADGSGAFAASRHRTGVGIGQRDLLVGCVLNRLLHYLQGAHLPAQASDLLLQPDRFGLGDIALFAVGLVQRSQVARDAGVDLLHPPNDLGDLGADSGHFGGGGLFSWLNMGGGHPERAARTLRSAEQAGVLAEAPPSVGYDGAERLYPGTTVGPVGAKPDL